MSNPDPNYDPENVCEEDEDPNEEAIKLWNER
jgi:hypothetical protein